MKKSILALALTMAASNAVAQDQPKLEILGDSAFNLNFNKDVQGISFTHINSHNSQPWALGVEVGYTRELSNNTWQERGEIHDVKTGQLIGVYNVKARYDVKNTYLDAFAILNFEADESLNLYLKTGISHVTANLHGVGNGVYTDISGTKYATEKLDNTRTGHGLGYGAGVNYKINDWLIGADYTHRNVKLGDPKYKQFQNVSLNKGTFTFRVGYQF